MDPKPPIPSEIVTEPALSDTMLRVVAPLANGATYGGAGSAILFGLRADEFAAIVGAIVGVAGLALKWWYERQRLKLQERHFEALRRSAQSVIDGTPAVRE